MSISIRARSHSSLATSAASRLRLHLLGHGLLLLDTFGSLLIDVYLLLQVEHCSTSEVHSQSALTASGAVSREKYSRPVLSRIAHNNDGLLLSVRPNRAT